MKIGDFLTPDKPKEKPEPEAELKMLEAELERLESFRAQAQKDSQVRKNEAGSIEVAKNRLESRIKEITKRLEKLRRDLNPKPEYKKAA